MTSQANWTRREVLLAAGAGLVIGATAGEGANLAFPAGTGDGPNRSAPSSDSASVVIPPGESLMYEHGVLKRLLLIYQSALTRLDQDQPTAADAINRAAMIIHEYIEGFHEAIEEGYVFPLVRTIKTLAPTVNTLLTQHARGRLITQLLLTNSNTTALDSDATRAEVTSAIDAFVRMYQPHEAREDTVIFPAYRSLLNPRQLEDQGQTLIDLETSQFGSNALTKIVNEVAQIEQSLGIYDLNDFTPPALHDATGHN